MHFDAVVIGGGAAGLFCAIEAGKRGRRVAVLESNSQVGRKIIISGGGRCNFTNREVTGENFISSNPHFAKSALARFTPEDFIAIVRTHAIDFYEKTRGQLFCRGSSREVVEMLLSEARSAKVKIFTNTHVAEIEHRGRFIIRTSSTVFEADSLVIATGGRSFPKLGATGFGYDVARQFGHSVTQTRPSLVALRMKDKGFSSLAGTSAEAEVSCGNARFREKILFTHRGLSGPAILQISNYWEPGSTVKVDLLPDLDLAGESLAEKGYEIEEIISETLPRKVVEALTVRGGATTSSTAESLKNWKPNFDGTEGWDRAEVTLGGVSTDDISSQTMASKKVPGLYFIGEVLDVTGWLGGYNFQWAWASGAAAGRAI